MNNDDLAKVNNILISSTTSILTLGESQNSPSFVVLKDYYDFVLSVLTARKSTTSIFNQFYKVAESDNIIYDNKVPAKFDLTFLIGG